MLSFRTDPRCELYKIFRNGTKWKIEGEILNFQKPLEMPTRSKKTLNYTILRNLLRELSTLSMSVYQLCIPIATIESKITEDRQVLEKRCQDSNTGCCAPQYRTCIGFFNYPASVWSLFAGTRGNLIVSLWQAEQRECLHSGL